MGRITWFWWLALMIWGSAAFAQIKDDSFSMTVTGGGYVFDGEENIEPTPVLGTRLGFDMIRHMGLEASFNFAKSKSDIDQQSSLNSYMYRLDALFYLLPDSWFVPYLSAGGGIVQNIGFEGLRDSSAPVLDYGIGTKIFVSDNVALRLEGRHFAVFDVDRRFNYEGTLGINYYFGRGAKKPIERGSATEKEREAPLPTAAIARPVVPSPAIASAESALPLVGSQEPTPRQSPAQVAAAGKNQAAGNQTNSASPEKPQLSVATTTAEAVSPNPAPTQAPIVPSAPAAALSVTAKKEAPRKISVQPGIVDEMTCEIRISFAPGSSKVQLQYHDEVMKLAELMKFYANSTITLEGFGDGKVKNQSYNALSLKRAQSVAHYLNFHFGIPKERIKPIAATKVSTKGVVRVTIFLQ